MFFLTKKTLQFNDPYCLLLNKYPMKNLITSKRSRALFGIGIVAISIGLISKKIINYPVGGCMKGTQEITFNI